MTTAKRTGANPELFARMSVPFADPEVANDALTAFYADVAAAREKHKIMNVVVITEIRVADGSADGMRAGSSYSCGDSGSVLPMTARFYGQEREAFEHLLSECEKDGRDASRRRRVR